MMGKQDTFKAGYIAIIGKPNVGKSTLLNKLLDFKLSITSPRPQTTRKRVMGIMNKPGFQIIFLDTPGLLTPKYHLQRALGKFVQTSIDDADALLFMVEAKTPFDHVRIEVTEDVEALTAVNPFQKPVILVINKDDLIPKNQLLPLIKLYADIYPFDKLIPISALRGDGLNEVELELQKLLPFHHPFYDPDTLTEQPERFFVSEFIREQIFLHYREEIPFSTEVQIEEFKERYDGKDIIRAVIYVERDSQKGIIIGKQGSALKAIGIKARKTIEDFLGRDIFLELHVKVSKDWRKSEHQIKKFGY
jgi:GTP-binding protein Era